MEQMTQEFESYMQAFRASLSSTEVEVAEEVRKVIEAIDIGQDKKGFSSWAHEELVRAREKLSRLSEPLGEFISYHETHSDFAYIWRKGKQAVDWQPMKTELGKRLKGIKVTNVEVENELTVKYMEQQYYSMLHRRRADELILLLESVDRMLRSIDSRIREVERQGRLSQDHYVEPNLSQNL